MIHLIENKKTNTIYHVDDHLSLSDIQSAEPRFFSVKFGKRETFDVYRGFLIVRHTINNDRKTVVYIFDTKEKYSLMIANSNEGINTIKKAERFIDWVIKNLSFN